VLSILASESSLVRRHVVEIVSLICQPKLGLKLLLRALLVWLHDDVIVLLAHMWVRFVVLSILASESSLVRRHVVEIVSLISQPKLGLKLLPGALLVWLHDNVIVLLAHMGVGLVVLAILASKGLLK